MTISFKHARRTLGGLEKTVARLKAQARDLGLGLSFWDNQTQLVVDVEPACEFCQVVCPGGYCDPGAAGELAGRVAQSESPHTARSGAGCFLLALPVHQRQRLAGVIVACLPVREMLDEESLARTCDRLELDRQATVSLLGRSCRHSTDQAGHFLIVLQHLLKSEQAVQVAQEELASLSSNLTVTYEELSVLYSISSSMKLTEPPREFLQRVCKDLQEVMNVQAVVAVSYAYPPAGQDILVRSGQIDLSDAELAGMAASLADRLAEAGKPVVDNHVGRPGAQARVGQLVAAPLVVEQTRIGLLVALNKRGREFDSADVKLIGSIGNQSSVFLANHRLYADLQDLLMGVLHALTATIDAKDPYTSGHSQRVARISRRLAERMGFGPDKIQQIYLAGLLHDIGKIGVTELTLRKEGRLTDEEYEDMKKHPLLGAKILGGIRQLEKEIPGILYHHERLDGRGYPYGLGGEQLPVEARIVGLADSFDAMTSDRTYRKALSLETVIQEIRNHAGTQFDPHLVDILLGMDLKEFLQEIRRDDGKVLSFDLGQERA